MRRWTVPTLAAITLLAIVLRVLPLTRFDIWGSDSGEYFRIASDLVGNGYVSTAYDGWGVAYPYFPGAEILMGAASLAAGLDLVWCLRLVVPVVGAFGPALVFLLGRRAFSDERAALVAAAIVTVAMPHVFATSHAMPGTLGDMLAILCFVLLLKTYDDVRALPLLAIATLALVPTHHLSTFFVLVPVLFATFVREFVRTKTHPTRMPVDAFYIAFLMSTALVYWLGLAVPFREEVMTEAFGLHPFIVAIAAVGILALAAGIVVARRKYTTFTYTPRYPALGREVGMLALMLLVMAVAFSITALVSVPGTNIKVEPVEVLYIVPISVILAVAIIGIGPAEFSRDGLFVLSWTGASGLVLAIGIATQNTVLLPYRQLQYLMVPMGLLAGWGIVYLADAATGPGSRSGRSGMTRKQAGLACGAAVACLIVLAGATSDPPKGLLGGFEEGTTTVEMDAVLWCGQEVPARGTMVATDHRMSSMLFGFAGLDGTWDSAYHTLHDDLDGALDELRSVDAPARTTRVDYVLIDDVMKEGVALEQWENAEPMSDEAVAKFDDPPFQKVYEGNGGVEIFFVGDLGPF